MGDGGFEDFVADGGEDALVVVEAEGLREGGVVSGWERALGVSNCMGGKVWMRWYGKSVPDRSLATF